jgi:Uma2 family endonuclease
MAAINQVKTPIIRRTMSREEFLAQPESVTPAEYIDGEAFMAPSPDPDHQFVSGDINKVVDRLVPPDGVLLYAPQDIWFGKDIIQPDLFWIRPDGDCVRVAKHWVGAPDLTIEILSPSTAKHDKDKKFKIYEQYGVREYWLVSIIEETVEVHVLKDGKFSRYGVFGAEDTFISPVLNDQTVTVSEFFKRLR